ncbi:MAG: polyprenol phosphomannose-dependent alpha 1,6 mannosyltransferase MptB [Lawsonella clevelandensis]
MLNVLARAPFAAVGLCLIGTTVLVVSWLTMMRYALPLRHFHRGESDITQMTRGQTWTVLAAWSIPLFFTAPMFSKDVYSYVAFGYAAHQGLDVYAGGPQDLLHGGPLVDNVPLEWRHTPAQYGAGFVAIARLIGALTGENIVASIVCYRVLALLFSCCVGYCCALAGTPMQYAGGDRAVVGSANPLTLFHMVAGIHNEGIMLALTMVGLAIGLEGTRFPGDQYGAGVFSFLALALSHGSKYQITRNGCVGFSRYGGCPSLVERLVGDPSSRCHHGRNYGSNSSVGDSSWWNQLGMDYDYRCGCSVPHGADVNK